MVLPKTGLMFWVGKLMKSVKSMKDAAVQVTAVRILRLVTTFHREVIVNYRVAIHETKISKLTC